MAYPGLGRIDDPLLHAGEHDMSKPRKTARIGDTERVAVPIVRRRARETDHIVRIVEQARDAAIAHLEAKKP